MQQTVTPYETDISCVEYLNESMAAKSLFMRLERNIFQSQFLYDQLGFELSVASGDIPW